MARRTEGASDQLLTEILEVLVRKWGYPTVRIHLENLNSEEGRRISGGTSKNPRDRPTARGYVSKTLDLPSSTRQLLLQFADRFDERKFLPALPDIRSFLDTKEPRAKNIKTRNAAIPFVIRKLRGLPESKLTELLEDRSFAGPSQLGPLAEAIKSSSAGLRAGLAHSDLPERERITASDNRGSAFPKKGWPGHRRDD